jgi:hypothetical protein
MKHRILAVAEARSLGYGGIQKISKFTDLSRPTIYRVLDDLDETAGKKAEFKRVRNPGGGHKRNSEVSTKTAQESSRPLALSAQEEMLVAYRISSKNM